jgi:hypothetical protein
VFGTLERKHPSHLQILWPATNQGTLEILLGTVSTSQLIAGIRECVIELVRLRYADFGPSLAAEMLLEKDCVKVSGETLRMDWSAMHVSRGIN